MKLKTQMDLSHMRPATNGGAHRRLASWIGSFLEFTEDFECPPIWRQWAAISTIAAVLERKVWATTTKGDLYPNMYVILVGAAGTGKSLAINGARKILECMATQEGDAASLHLASTSMTMASMADELAQAKRVVLRPGQNPPMIEFNSLAIFNSEMSSFMDEYAKDMMGGLTDIWDNGNYSQSRRGGNLKVRIPHAQINLITGSTPTNLIEFMPEIAWTQGFASRMIMVYSGDKPPMTDIFSDIMLDPEHEKAFEELLADLRVIGELYGKIVFTKEAVALFRAWREGGEKPVPDHPKLIDYCARRTAHLIKLCMVASASRGDDRQITAQDFETARAWLFGAEMAMPDVFRSGAGKGDSQAMDECWHFVMTMNAKRGRPVPEHEVVHFLRDRVPSHAVMRVLEIMVRDGSLKMNAKQAGFEPGPRALEF